MNQKFDQTRVDKVTGDTLLRLGYKPGRWFKDAISYANENGLRGDELVEFLDTRAPKTIKPFDEPIHYHKNITATTDLERENLAKVEATMRELLKTPTIVNATIMPDACPAGPVGQIPVGGVAVARNAIHPAMHSADICCSVMMTNFGKVEPKKVLDAGHAVTHFGRGGRRDAFLMPNNLREKLTGNPFLNDPGSIELSEVQLGTQGDGNHFLYVGQSRNSGETIVVTHHGSRGFGARLFKGAMKVAENYRKEISPETLSRNAWIPYETEDGTRYWDALQIVRQWTKLNHEVIHAAIGRRVNRDVQDRFWNEHNFVFKEDDLFYHAKGATPLADKFVPDSTNSLRLIPLNMSQPILVVTGEKTATNLGFAPHGAGRNCSRSQHIKDYGTRSIESIFAEETAGLDVRFFSGNIDVSELPSAYKDAMTVKTQMEEFGLGDVVDEIAPYGCIMAGDWNAGASWKQKRDLAKKDL